jgi:hypothetical protein
MSLFLGRRDRRSVVLTPAGSACPGDVAASPGRWPLRAVVPSCELTDGNPMKPWSGRRDSNPRRPAWEAGILPLNYSRSGRRGRRSVRP